MQIEVKNRLIKHLAFLEAELASIPGVRGLTWEAYQADAVQRRNVERLVENIVNSSIDVSKIVLGVEKLSVPDTYREIVQTLGVVTGFDKDNCEKLSRHVRLRNIISHEYLDVRWTSIKKFVDEAEPQYAKLVEDAKAYLLRKV